MKLQTKWKGLSNRPIWSHFMQNGNDYMKIELQNAFGVKWNDDKTGLRNLMVTLNPSLK